MPKQIDPDAVDAHGIDGVEPLLVAIGYELDATQMRPNIWQYEAGESNIPHQHEEQEELYLLIRGSVTIEAGDTAHELTNGDVLLVEPSTTRQVIAEEQSTLFVVGAPNVAEDEILVE